MLSHRANLILMQRRNAGVKINSRRFASRSADGRIIKRSAFASASEMFLPPSASGFGMLRGDPVKSLLAFALFSLPCTGLALDRVAFNHPGLSVDLGVGLWAWPMPMDWDGDGDLDLLVACPDKPSNGVYFFENADGVGKKMPVFKKAQRLGPAAADMVLSMAGKTPRIFAGQNELPNFRQGDWTTRKPIYPAKTVVPIRNSRDHFWRLADFDGDGNHDLVVGHGDWTDFGWFDKNQWWKDYNWQGVWTGAPLHGRVWWLRNEASDAEPKFGPPQPVLADGKQVDVFGRPGQNLADFDGDGDLDLLCGEFLDGFTYFENIGSRKEPRYAAGRRLVSAQGTALVMDLEMIVPHAIDWDGDGDTDLIVGDEDGRVALVEHTGRIADGTPVFNPPQYFQQEADTLKCGALATPVGADWDGDGDVDIVSGNTAGYIEWFENLSGPRVPAPKWAAPRRLEAGGKPFRIMAGPNGSPQGPCEAKWGYTTVSVADWDLDGLPDIVLNSIWGRVEWLKNIGTRTAPRLAGPETLRLAEPGNLPRIPWHWWTAEPDQLVTQWRTTPVVVDWNKDGLPDLVMLDGEGYLAFYERKKTGQGLSLLPPRRAFVNEQGAPIRLNAGTGGKAGRRKLSATDWDGDGNLDLLLNSANANFLRQVGTRDGNWIMRDEGSLSTKNIEGHDVSPTTVDWDGNGIPDLLGGAEDGRFYFLQNPRAAK